MKITNLFIGLLSFGLLILPVYGEAAVGQSGAGSKVGSGSIIDKSNQNNDYFRPVGEGTSIRSGNTERTTQYRNHQNLKNENRSFHNQSSLRNQNYYNTTPNQTVNPNVNQNVDRTGTNR